MAKLTLTDIANLTGNPTTAAAAINANSDLIEAALENTLSRDGTTPNTMSAALDMNSNKVTNVTTATSGGDAVNLTQLNAYASGSLSSIDASAVTYTPAGNITASTAEGAINELDTEKVKLSGDTMTGPLVATTLEATGDTSAGDNAAMGYTAAEGLILTGQGSTNDVTIKNDADAIVASVPTGTTTLKLNGGQLAFPATQAASSDANTLDDYEEGTFTPRITFDDSSTGITYNTQLGYYTKIGRKVHVSGKILLTDKGSATGTAAISGLPFTLATSSGNNGAASLWANVISFADHLQGRVLFNETKIVLAEITNAGAATFLDENNLSNTSEISFSLSYHI